MERGRVAQRQVGGQQRQGQEREALGEDAGDPRARGREGDRERRGRRGKSEKSIFPIYELMIQDSSVLIDPIS